MNFKRAYVKTFYVILTAFAFASCGDNANQNDELPAPQSKEYDPDMGISARQYNAACLDNEDVEVLPWHISNLLDCTNNTFYIPYELWSGASFDGQKRNVNNCMNDVDTTFVSSQTAQTSTNIKRVDEWRSPVFDHIFPIWERKKSDESKIQYFTCHQNGIGRVYDKRINKEDAYYSGTGVKFPAGNGWKINTLRSFFDKKDSMGARRTRETSIKIIDVEFNALNELISLQYAWWFDDTLDYIYTYQPNKSNTHQIHINQEIGQLEDLASFL